MIRRVALLIPEVGKSLRRFYLDIVNGMSETRFCSSCNLVNHNHSKASDGIRT
jgi:hypothetical protein